MAERPVDRDELRQVASEHPGTAALLLELLVHERMPETIPPLQIAEHAGPDAAALLEELSEVQTENQSLREQLAHELERRDETAAALDLGHAVGAEKHEDEVADLKQQLAGARVQIESLEGQRSAHLRELHDLRQRATPKPAPTPPAAANPPARGVRMIESATKPGVLVPSVECKVDGCTDHGPARGNAAGLCRDHRHAVNEGRVVLIDGRNHQRVQGSLQPIAATSCVDCGAKLSQYRDADETRCATHAGVTAA